jgi:hypothetical protein
MTSTANTIMIMLTTDKVLGLSSVLGAAVALHSFSAGGVQSLSQSAQLPTVIESEQVHVILSLSGMGVQVLVLLQAAEHVSQSGMTTDSAHLHVYDIFSFII